MPLLPHHYERTIRWLRENLLGCEERSQRIVRQKKEAGYMLAELLIAMMIILSVMSVVMSTMASSVLWAQRLENTCEIMFDGRLCRLLISNYLQRSDKKMYLIQHHAVSNGQDGFYFVRGNVKRELSTGQLQVVGLEDLPPYKNPVMFRPLSTNNVYDGSYFEKNLNGTYSMHWRETAATIPRLRGRQQIIYRAQTTLFPAYDYFTMADSYQKE